MRRRDYRNYSIKDTWTKSRGRVEVGEGGGFSWGGVEGDKKKKNLTNETKSRKSRRI